MEGVGACGRRPAGQPAAALLPEELVELLGEEEPEDDELLLAAGAASFLPLDDELDSPEPEEELDRLSVR